MGEKRMKKNEENAHVSPLVDETVCEPERLEDFDSAALMKRLSATKQCIDREKRATNLHSVGLTRQNLDAALVDDLGFDLELREPSREHDWRSGECIRWVGRAYWMSLRRMWGREEVRNAVNSTNTTREEKD
jgi:hypothetical protein